MNNTIKLIAACALSVTVSSAFTQNMRMETPQNIANLQASGSVETQQDLLMISMNTTKDGVEAANVQTLLKTALDSALAEAKKAAQPGRPSGVPRKLAPVCWLP